MNVRIIIMVFFPIFAIAQAPQKINFQSVLRNTTGEVVSNSSVSLRISILRGTITGTSDYIETHAKTTDASGLISLQIGNGTVISGIFANIDWGGASHFIKLEADFSGGSNYVVLGTQELMSVPYALYASKTDTSVLNLTSRFATKLSGTDTVSLSNRIDATANSGSSDTSLLNLTSRFSTKLNITDTASLSNRIDLKLTKTDTASLSNRIDLKLTKTDTASLSNRIDLKLTKTDTASLSNRIDAKAPLANPVFTGTVLGIDKTMVGLPNVNNTSDLNKPVSTATQDSLNLKLNRSDFPSGSNTGNILYWNGLTWVNLAPGQNGQALILVNGIPSWSGAAFPTLTTSSVASISFSSVISGGNISSDGGAEVSARGLVYGTSTNPTLSNSVFTIGSGTDSFSGTLTGLSPITTYYVRAYATNSAGTGYGNEVIFQTLPFAVPTLVTTDASGITQTTVTSGGTVSNEGGATVTERGIVYGTITNPTTSNTKITSGSGTGSFSVTVTALIPNTTYYIRSYAINSAGTGYGNNITFQTTVTSVPSLTTRELLNITNTTATGGGSITNDGGSIITVKGICWGTSPNPTTLDSKTTDGTGTTTFTSFITGLSASVTYYVRAYATNSTGTGYGNQETFTTSTTSNTLPVVTSTSVTRLTTVQATFNAEVNSQGGGTVTERGAVWNTGGNPTVNSNRVPSGSGTGVYTATITGLSLNSNYYVRAYAINNFGISYGVEIPYTNLLALATLTTNNVIAQSFTASSGGNITDDGGSTVTARGVVWSTSQNPSISDSKTTDGSGTGSYVSNFTDLSPGTTYYVRAYATNITGTAYGDQQTFSSIALPPPVTDIDGNTYNTVQIGNQVWMSENLKTSRYRNGGSIPYVVGNTDWQALTTGAWSNYNHDAANELIYGKLYNWYTTLGDTLCPTGWHVPTDAEWTTLSSNLGGESVAGGKMKSIGTAYWNTPNTGATNESGFSALPGGYRDIVGSFFNIRNDAFFWSATEVSNFIAKSCYLVINDGYANRYIYPKSFGGSVRCLRD
jgi:uncharacterized protein (TIGR02145 family)